MDSVGGSGSGSARDSGIAAVPAVHVVEPPLLSEALQLNHYNQLMLAAIRGPSCSMMNHNTILNPSPPLLGQRLMDPAQGVQVASDIDSKRILCPDSSFAVLCPCPVVEAERSAANMTDPYQSNNGQVPILDTVDQKNNK